MRERESVVGEALLVHGRSSGGGDGGVAGVVAGSEVGTEGGRRAERGGSSLLVRVCEVEDGSLELKMVVKLGEESAIMDRDAPKVRRNEGRSGKMKERKAHLLNLSVHLVRLYVRFVSS